jgi:hypothetical protein
LDALVSQESLDSLCYEQAQPRRQPLNSRADKKQLWFRAIAAEPRGGLASFSGP